MLHLPSAKLAFPASASAEGMRPGDSRNICHGGKHGADGSSQLTRAAVAFCAVSAPIWSRSACVSFSTAANRRRRIPCSPFSRCDASRSAAAFASNLRRIADQRKTSTVLVRCEQCAAGRGVSSEQPVVVGNFRCPKGVRSNVQHASLCLPQCSQRAPAR